MKQLLIILTFLSPITIHSQSYIREGKGDYNKVLYTWDGKYLRQGKGAYNSVLYTLTNKYIRQGKGDYNTVLYTVDGYIPIEVLIVAVM
ncbi:MAG TPA: hypothetical protein VK050_10090 [Flavobacteriaceae bacterium]|nr:hypothetical protein [Flavobacteriaceae bacterium]